MNELSAFLDKARENEVSLIPALHKAKQLYGELSVESLREIADGLGLPFSRIAGVSTFYSAFNGMDDGKADDRFLADMGGSDRLAWFSSHPTKYQAVKRVLAENLDVVGLMRQAKLRGRSGSGFPMADKWSLTARAPGEVKYLVCNGNEGEGDTYKDYLLLTTKPEAVVEGMVICALAVGAEKGFLCVRAEYEQSYRAVFKCIETAYAAGILGQNILGSGKNFELEAVLGGGAYVSGEETGLIEMLEGQRGEPKLKPPYPGVCGLYKKPTIVNNAESFAATAILVLRGVEQFQAAGTKETGGIKLYTISGCVKYPGVYELPHNTTVGEALKTAGGSAAGGTVKGFQLGGGATGGFGGTDLLEMALDFGPAGTVGLSLGTAAIRFIGPDESVPALALKSITFLREQSCGLCTACRNGLAELADALTLLCDGQGSTNSVSQISELCQYIEQNARCALGQAAPTAVRTSLQAFPKEFEQLCRKEKADVYFL